MSNQIYDPNPLISVIIPAFNAEKYLEEALTSINQQNYNPLEIIVIDDGSTDNTAKIAKDFSEQVKYIYQENSGPATARNTGIKMAEGDYISFLDADDLWLTNTLKIQLDLLQKSPQSKIVLGKTQFVRYNQNKLLLERIGEPRFFLNLGSAIYHKSVFNEVGLLDENLTYSEDIDWFNRAREKNINIIKHQEIVLFYRQHENNMTNNKNSEQLAIMKVLKKSLNRRRKSPQILTNQLPKISDI